MSLLRGRHLRLKMRGLRHGLHGPYDRLSPCMRSGWRQIRR